MKKNIAIAMVILMAITLTPLMQGGIDVVSGASTGGGGGGGGGTTGTAPKAPTVLALPAAYSPADTTVKLVWKDNSTNESGFRLDRFIKGGSAWVQVASIAANATSYTDTGLKASTTYYYRLKAYNNYGISAATNELAITTAKSTGAITPVTYSNTPSVWAVAEIDKANLAGLTVESLLSAYNKPITRVEFSELVVKLYEKATGKIATPVSPNPFTDTTNEAVLKAYGLGIVNGTATDKFSPNANITRQEISVMIIRQLLATNPTGNYKVSDDYTNIFADQSLIATWAIDAIKFMNQEGIVNGVGAGKVDPIGNTTREQSILMVYRTYEQFVLPAGGSDDSSTSETDDSSDDESAE